MKKGQVQLAVAGLVSSVAFAGIWLGNYILNAPAQTANAIEKVKEDLTVIQVKDGNRITALETDTATIKASQLRTESDIKEILRIVK